MRIALSQYDPLIGDVEGNAARIRQELHRAKEAKADLLVLPELSLCGYPPQDLLEFDAFIERCQSAIEDLAKDCTDISAIVGAPALIEGHPGKKRYNSAYFLENGKLRSVHHKTLLPDYDVFDERRHFEPAPEQELIHFGEERIALTICEDLWNVHEELHYEETPPMERLIEDKPTLMINIAASPFDMERPHIRREVLKKNAERYALPLFYVGTVGGQTDLIFDGGSMVLNNRGKRMAELPYFSTAFRCIDTGSSVQEEEDKLPEECERLRQALVVGMRDFFSKLGMNKAIFGCSGGIDSALTCALATEALGPENVYAVMMPSEFSSEGSISDSEQLVENLGCRSDSFPIRELYEQYLGTLAPRFEGTEFGVAEENLQSRSRAVLLMALSNKFGHLLLNTSNKSELAVGYGTLYGDLCGALSVLGDVYKMQAYRLAEHLNQERERIPRNIIEKAPSAELKPDQKDSDTLPPYSTLDKILYRYIEGRKSRTEIIAEGFETSTVERAIKAVDTSEYKRYQAAPVLRVSSKAFGIGRRMPLVRSFREPGGTD